MTNTQRILTESCNSTQTADVVIVGAGAAGLFAAIHAGRASGGRRIIVLDGAKTLGAKILVAGGGRCNVTHDHVDASAYAGSSRKAIDKVLKRFDVARTIAFFDDLGVTLKREPTGKLFPTTDSARTVLDALLGAAQDAGVQIAHPRRVEWASAVEGSFCVGGAWGAIETGKLILATGGKSLPKSGSDGAGYRLAERFGHTITDRVFPALVPLLLPSDHLLTTLSGIAAPALLEVRSGTGKRLHRVSGAVLCTHFGLSGPAVLDISRYYTDAYADDPAAQLVITWLPDADPEALEARLIAAPRTPILHLIDSPLPERMTRTLCQIAGVDPAERANTLTRERRRALIAAFTGLVMPITGDRGFTYAEVTAGGVPLSEIRLETMESRCTPGVHVIGELCNVDGRIGGYNFQWAWSSGYVAGVSV